METLWSDARFRVGFETVADRGSRVGGTGLFDRRFLDLRRIEGPPGGDPLIENLRPLGIRFALGCKGSL
jgi:NADPH-dependent 2,4-dienoyl-CoA reductase/sulfur reductase-like enzyme